MCSHRPPSYGERGGGEDFTHVFMKGLFPANAAVLGIRTSTCEFGESIHIVQSRMLSCNHIIVHSHVTSGQMGTWPHSAAPGEPQSSIRNIAAQLVQHRPTQWNGVIQNSGAGTRRPSDSACVLHYRSTEAQSSENVFQKHLWEVARDVFQRASTLAPFVTLLSDPNGAGSLWL